MVSATFRKSLVLTLNECVGWDWSSGYGFKSIIHLFHEANYQLWPVSEVLLFIKRTVVIFNIFL